MDRVNVASIGAIVGFASSIDSSALPQAAAEFGVSEVAESLATGLFLVGFGAGESLFLRYRHTHREMVYFSILDSVGYIH